MSDKEYETRRQNVKRLAKIRDVPLWKVAALIGVNDGNLSRKLRRLTPETERELCGAIITLSEGGE